MFVFFKFKHINFNLLLNVRMSWVSYITKGPVEPSSAFQKHWTFNTLIFQKNPMSFFLMILILHVCFIMFSGIPPHVDTHSAFEDTILSLSLGAKVSSQSIVWWFKQHELVQRNSHHRPVGWLFTQRYNSSISLHSQHQSVVLKVQLSIIKVR